MKSNKTYAIIHFEDKKPIKRAYETASEAMYDYLDQNCVLVELFNSNGSRVCSIKPTGNYK